MYLFKELYHIVSKNLEERKSLSKLKPTNS
ncbi:uncharacterized protein METZ01_LOCUS361260 [marine metagenome]|uniref:Uncharacterized protein n=1 Tax=marine metagenome TaxID=408172 RepID=A0A382SEX6_9ZZZZ